MKAKGHDDRIGFNHDFAPRDRLRTPTAIRTRLSQPGLDNFDADRLAKIIHDLNRLAIKQELHALLFGIRHLAPRAGHVLFVASINTIHPVRLLPHRRSHAVHRGIATTQHHNRFFFEVDVLLRFAGVIHLFVDVGDQVIQRLVNAGQVLTGEPSFHGLVSAHAEEDGVVVRQQLIDRDVFADFSIQFELNAHALEHFPATFHHLLLKLELRYAEGQQAANLGVTVKHHRFHAIARQDIGTPQASRPGANNRNLFVSRDHIGQIRPPTHRQCSIGNVLLRIADGDSTEAVIESARPLTEPVLRTDAATDLGQGVGLMTEFGGLKQIAFGQQLQPIGDEVVYRALPLAIGIATFEATMGLLRCLNLCERIIDLDKRLSARIHVLLVRILTIDIEELKRVGQASAHGWCLSPYPAVARAID